ncbi:glycerate kinase [Brachybacterium phenoliresistens]|uniref:Glycerate kinase n=1 Tax=Brachybacterium phenoliresistens TaxID=396014 RepID=Z9JRK1_9MICO|nr:glycerate kinase [Brachybacterium phenoliresistens]EWS80829.1 glycerate kinase [Brachybacterium phenoliresistens]
MTHPAPRTVLLAPDKFKGTLTAAEVCDALETGISAAAPHARVLRCPIADGGDGTVEAALAAGFEGRTTTVEGPTGQPVPARWALRGADAVLELAETSGLRVLPGGDLAPGRASTRGLGELILAARDAGARRILVGLGGSATTDAGAGILQGLGAHLRTARGEDIAPGADGLEDLASVDLVPALTALEGVELVAACDVTNPLTGPEGAAAVYGPQKGIAPERIGEIDARLAAAGERIDPSGQHAHRPGAGAAGGAGFALYALGASFEAGADAVLALLGFDEALEQADTVVIGEGKLDEQTLHGKGPAEVARRAREAGREVLAVAGAVTLAPEQLRAAGIGAAYDLIGRSAGLEDALRRGPELLEGIGREIGAALGRG